MYIYIYIHTYWTDDVPIHYADFPASHVRSLGKMAAPTFRGPWMAVVSSVPSSCDRQLGVPGYPVPPHFVHI